MFYAKELGSGVVLMLKKKYTSENHVDGAGVHERGGGGDLSSRMLWMKSSEPRLEVR